MGVKSLITIVAILAVYFDSAYGQCCSNVTRFEETTRITNQITLYTKQITTLYFQITSLTTRLYTITTTSSSECNKYYIVPGKNITFKWMEALQKCQSMGMNLVSIEDSAKWTDLTNFLGKTKLEGMYFWISGKKDGDKWVWAETNQKVNLGAFKNEMRKNTAWNNLLLQTAVPANGMRTFVVDFDGNLGYIPSGGSFNLICEKKYIASTAGR